MIINKEQIDTVDSEGNLVKKLIISYVNKEGKISFMQWDIPKTEMFEWAYTNRANADKPFPLFDKETKQPITDETTGKQKFAQWKSYDNKFIRRIPTTKNLSEPRINEILNMFGKSIDPIFESNEPETWYCDIETDVSADGSPDADAAAMPINTIAITRFPQTIVFARKDLTENEKIEVQTRLNNYSELTKDYKFDFRYYNSEYSMLKAFVEFIIPIPAITGWNFLGYDWKYIYNRAQCLGIDLSQLSPTRSFNKFKLNRKIKIEVNVPNHKIISDYMSIYQMWDRTIEIKENDSLDWVSNKVLGIKKVEHEWGFEEFYRDHYMEYVFYNAVDTILVEKLHEKLKTAEVWYMLASELRIDLNAAFSTIQPVETVMTNFVYPQYKVVLKKPHSDEEAEDYVGAYVWPTQAGIYKFIGGLDFASLYPTTIRQFGISPETFLFKDKDGSYIPKSNEIKTTSGAVYRKDPDAILPAILTEFYAKRKAAKNDRKISDSGAEYLLKIYERRLDELKNK